jgi:hypothetical protein
MKGLFGAVNQLRVPPVVVNPVDGNLSLQFDLQGSGPFTPQPFLRYNVQSRSAESEKRGRDSYISAISRFPT